MAFHPSILFMPTIAFTPRLSLAFRDGFLLSFASHFIHPYSSGSLSERSFVSSSESCSETKLPTEHISVLNGPVIIADGTPFSFVEHFRATLGVSVTSSDTNVVI